MGGVRSGRRLAGAPFDPFRYRKGHQDHGATCATQQYADQARVRGARPRSGTGSSDRTRRSHERGAPLERLFRPRSRGQRVSDRGKEGAVEMTAQLSLEEFVFAIASVSSATAAARTHGDLKTAAVLAEYYALVAEA